MPWRFRLGRERLGRPRGRGMSSLELSSVMVRHRLRCHKCSARGLAEGQHYPTEAAIGRRPRHRDRIRGRASPESLVPGSGGVWVGGGVWAWGVTAFWFPPIPQGSFRAVLPSFFLSLFVLIYVVFSLFTHLCLFSHLLTFFAFSYYPFRNLISFLVQMWFFFTFLSSLHRTFLFLFVSFSFPFTFNLVFPLSP